MFDEFPGGGCKVCCNWIQPPGEGKTVVLGIELEFDLDRRFEQKQIRPIEVANFSQPHEGIQRYVGESIRFADCTSQRMTRELLDHVIEETNTGGHLIGAGPIEVHLDGNIGFVVLRAIRAVRMRGL